MTGGMLGPGTSYRCGCAISPGRFSTVGPVSNIAIKIRIWQKPVVMLSLEYPPGNVRQQAESLRIDKPNIVQSVPMRRWLNGVTMSCFGHHTLVVIACEEHTVSAFQKSIRKNRAL